MISMKSIIVLILIASLFAPVSANTPTQSVAEVTVQLDEQEYDAEYDLVVEYYYTLNRFYEPVYDDEFFSDSFIEWFSASEAKEIKKSLDDIVEEVKQIPDSDVVGILSLHQTPEMIMEFVERKVNGEEFPEINNSLLKIYYSMSKLQARKTVESLYE